MDERRQLSLLLVLIASMLALYAAALGLIYELPEVFHVHTSYVSVPLQLLFLAGAIWFARQSGRPLFDFGFALSNWRRSLGEGLLFTLPWLVLLCFWKWHSLGHPPLDQLFEHRRIVAFYGPPRLLGFIAVYVVMILAQQFIVRGVLQSSLERLLALKSPQIWAILLSTLLFSITHLHLSPRFALYSFFPGLFWGVLFARHRDLFGVTLSHALLGLTLFFVLGLDFLR